MNKKPTIRSLKKQLKEAEISAHDWQERYYDEKEKTGELEENIKQKTEIKIDDLYQKKDELLNNVNILKEIIRWLIKPSSAELEKKAEIEGIKLERERRRW